MVASPNWVRGAYIGKGSFGTVSLAVRKSDGRVFAVKSVDRSGCLGSQLECLENEIRILRSVSSPYVVEYIGDDGTMEGPTASHWRNLHMEYLPGGTVADLANSTGTPGDELTVRSYTRCIVSALSHLHARGIVHCDVKGKNVLVGHATGAAKLADFGAAVDELSASSTLPRGTPLWMAPEVIRREHQGPESDVWSLGCTVIEMLTGKPAWEDRGADTLRRIGYSNDTPELPPGLSELGRDFLDKCLRRERSERWSSHQLLHHPFVSSSPPSNMATPRSVLDCIDSEFSDEDDDDVRISNMNCELQGICNARERIRKLATNTGANWESAGWVVVRNLIGETEEVPGLRGRVQEGEGTSSQYGDLVGTQEEPQAVNLGHREETGAAGHSSGRAGPETSWACWYGSSDGGVKCEGCKSRSTTFFVFVTALICNSPLIIYHILFEIPTCDFEQPYTPSPLPLLLHILSQVLT